MAVAILSLIEAAKLLKSYLRRHQQLNPAEAAEGRHGDKMTTKLLHGLRAMTARGLSRPEQEPSKEAEF